MDCSSYTISLYYIIVTRTDAVCFQYWGQLEETTKRELRGAPISADDLFFAGTSALNWRVPNVLPPRKLLLELESPDEVLGPCAQVDFVSLLSLVGFSISPAGTKAKLLAQMMLDWTSSQ